MRNVIPISMIVWGLFGLIMIPINLTWAIIVHATVYPLGILAVAAQLLIFGLNKDNE